MGLLSLGDWLERAAAQDRLAAIAAEVSACETAAELVERARGDGTRNREGASR